MSHKTLPYLNYLKTTFSNLSTVIGADEGAAMQIGAASRLLDYMIEQRMAAPELKAESYAALLKLLPAIKEITPPNSDGALIELIAICAASDPAAFDRFIQLLGEIQRHLFALNLLPATALCKAIVRIEADYNRKFEAAVVAQTLAAATESKAAANARNTRAYDEGKLLDFIRGSFPQEPTIGIKHSEFVTGGYSKFTLSITLSNAKSLPENIILRADASATYGGALVVDEYRLLKIVHENAVRVPKPLALEQTGKVFGSPFMLMEKEPGISIGNMFSLPKTNKSVCRDVAEQLAAIHRVPLAAFGNRIDKARSSDKALAWIDESLAAWKPLNMPSPVFETAFEWLRRNAGLNDKSPRTLVHGDYGLHNILVHDDRVSTILDWEHAHFGNPAYDLGYFYDTAVSLDSWEAFLDAYGKAGAPVPDEDQLDYHILFATTRLGAMICQTTSAFASEPVMASAFLIGKLSYENSVMRISRALDRVL